MTADAEPRAGSIVRRLERVVPSGPPRDVVGGAEHPMRDATRAAAFEPGWWTPDRAKEIETFFDELADDWDRRFSHDQTRLAPLEDALARGGPVPPAPASTS